MCITLVFLLYLLEVKIIIYFIYLAIVVKHSYINE